MFYIYILYSQTANKFYVGHSQDPWERQKQHNLNPVEKFTGKFKDWELQAVFEVSAMRGEADNLERFIKKQKSRKLLKKLIDMDFVPEGVLGKLVRVPHVRD